MSARTQRTLLRLFSIFLAAGAGDALIQFSTGATSYDYRHLAGALVAAAVLAVEQFLKSSGDNAAPTIAAVNAAIRSGVPATIAGGPGPVSLVSPPSEPTPKL